MRSRPLCVCNLAHIPPHCSCFPTNTHIDFVISFASKVVALMNVLAARRKKLIPIEKGTDPTLSH